MSLALDSAPSTHTPDPYQALCLAEPLFAARYSGWTVLGRGARAVVVRTYLRDAATAVALKVFVGLGETERHQLRLEAQAVMRLQHPCVLRGYTVFDRGVLAWLEFEPVEGGTLADEIARRRSSGEGWPVEQALELGACLAEGLAAVHAAGFVHRDVKPSNVLLTRAAWPPAKLADFGIARAFDSTDTGDELAGSAQYLCPEAEESRGAAGDVYALALVLYEIFSAGAFPFPLGPSVSFAALREAHRVAEPVALEEYAPRLPPEVLGVVRRGLSKNPAQRPTAAEMAREIRQALEPRADEWSTARPYIAVIGIVLWASLVSMGLTFLAFVRWLLNGA